MPAWRAGRLVSGAIDNVYAPLLGEISGGRRNIFLTGRAGRILLYQVFEQGGIALALYVFVNILENQVFKNKKEKIRWKK